MPSFITYGTPFSNKSNNFSRRIREFVEGSFSQNSLRAADADFIIADDDVVDKQLNLGLAHGRTTCFEHFGGVETDILMTSNFEVR